MHRHVLLTDANMDGVVQANELTGVPTSSSARFNTSTGVLAPVGKRRGSRHSNREDARGWRHAAPTVRRLRRRGGLHYRKYDRGLAVYTLGYEPRAGLPAAADLHRSAEPYRSHQRQHGRVLRREAGAMRPSGAGSITMTNPNYQIYHGVDFTVTKRYSDKWQVNAALTVQTNPHFLTVTSISPTPRGGLSRRSSTIRSYAC